MLKRAYAVGVREAFKKFALEAPGAIDEFIAEVEKGKDVAPTDAEAPSSELLPEDPQAGTGVTTAKVAIGLKDMLFFEQQLGKDEAGKLFSDLHAQWTGRPGFARRGTLNIGPNGVQLQPFEHPLPQVAPKPVIPPTAASAAPRAMPPPLPSVLRR